MKKTSPLYKPQLNYISGLLVVTDVKDKREFLYELCKWYIYTLPCMEDIEKLWTIKMLDSKVLVLGFGVEIALNGHECFYFYF